MYFLFRRARTRLLKTALLALLAGVVPPASADEPHPAALELGEAAELAVKSQPLLEEQRAKARAAGSRAVAAGQLPDPMLTGGVMQIPVNTEDAWSFTRDNFTALSVGISQEFPRAAKRRLRSEREEREADAARARESAMERTVRRDAGLAFLDAYYPNRARELVARLVVEAQRERQAAEINFRVGRAAQSDVLSAEVSAELLRDRADALQQDGDATLARLARWIGEAAQRPLAETLPVLPNPPPLPVLLDALQTHPQLLAETAVVRTAETELALAQADYKPDWRVDLRYDNRLEFSDFVTLMVGVDLPLFTGKRQDRRADAARETIIEAQARRGDELRKQRAELTASHRQWTRASERLGRYDAVLLPRAQSSVDAAIKAYQAGAGDISAVLQARRSLLDVQLMRLELATDIIRRRLELEFFNPEVQS